MWACVNWLTLFFRSPFEYSCSPVLGKNHLIFQWVFPKKTGLTAACSKMVKVARVADRSGQRRSDQIRSDQIRSDRRFPLRRHGIYCCIPQQTDLRNTVLVCQCVCSSSCLCPGTLKNLADIRYYVSWVGSPLYVIQILRNEFWCNEGFMTIKDLQRCPQSSSRA